MADQQEVVPANVPIGNTPLRCWYVLVARGKAPKLVGPVTEEKMIADLRRLNNDFVHAFPFFGCPYQITRGPARHLVTPDGRRLPLFDQTLANQVDDEGRLFDDASDDEIS